MPVSGNGTAVRGLGGAAGFGETALPRSDDGSLGVDVSSIFQSGFNYFGSQFGGNQLFINTNGTLTFGSAYGAYPTLQNLNAYQNMIALFWADIDTRIDGEGAESGQIWLDLDSATDTVTITWENVGSYRRNADQTNLFQVQLVDRGSGNFDIILRYERIDWTIGTSIDDAGAHGLLSGARLPAPLAIGGPVGALDTALGNTGIAGLYLFEMRGGTLPGAQPVAGLSVLGDSAANVLEGGASADVLRGFGGNDILRGHGGNDWIYGGDGADTLNGGAGDDVIFGGDTSADLRDVIYGGDGHDNIDAGYGNDLVYGGNGNDTIAGGFGADELHGQGGDDVISGSALSDVIFGGDGNDFINGGFGHDRLNGGAGADRFYHLGIHDHGSDWIQDYNAAEGDVLFWGGPNTTAAMFQVNYADTPNAGIAGISEAFVIYRPTGQIIWALIDGGGQTDINLQIGNSVFDLV